MHRIILQPLIGLAVFCISLQASAESPFDIGPKIRDATERGIVKIQGCGWQGTGVIVNFDGDIITNNHVVDGCPCSELSALLSDGQRVRCRSTQVLSENYRSLFDLAILNFRFPVNFHRTVIPIALEPPTVGELVYSLGFPFDDMTMTSGVVSLQTFPGKPGYLMHDCAINHGNSGGPLLNVYGQLVGLNTFSVNDKQFQNGALKANIILKTLDLKKTRYSTNHLIESKEDMTVVRYIPTTKVEYVYVPSTPSLIAPEIKPFLADKPQFGDALFSRYILGTSSITRKNSNESRSGPKEKPNHAKTETTYYDQLEAGHWDLIGFRGDSGFDVLLFTEITSFLENESRRHFDAAADQTGVRIDYYPFQHYWNDLLGAQMYIGVGYSLLNIEYKDQSDPKYSYSVSGSGAAASIGIDLFLGKYLGLSASWNGFQGKISSYATSDEAKNQSAILRESVESEDLTYTINTIGLGLTLNVDI